MLPTNRFALHLCAVIVAVVAAIDTSHVSGSEVRSLLRLSHDNMQEPGGTHDEDYELYVRTQVVLLRSPYVVSAALRDPNVGQLPLVRQQSDPVHWLTEALIVERPDRSELVRLRMFVGKDDDRKQMISLLDAVVKAYMDEIVYGDLISARLRHDTMNEGYRRTLDEVQEKHDKLRKLAEQIGSVDSEAVKVRTELLRHSHERLTNRLEKLDATVLELTLKRIAAQAQSTKDHEEAMAVLDAQIEFLRQQTAELKTELEKDGERLVSLCGSSGELEVGKQQLDHLQTTAAEMKKEMDRIELGLKAPSRVKVIQPAFLYGRSPTAEDDEESAVRD